MTYETSATMKAKFLGQRGVNINRFPDRDKKPQILIPGDDDTVTIKITEEKADEIEEVLGE